MSFVPINTDVKLSCGQRYHLKIPRPDYWALGYSAEHLASRGEAWDLILNGQAEQLAKYFMKPCKNPYAGIVILYEKWISLLEEGIRFGSTRPYHLHLTKWSRKDGREFKTCMFLSRAGIIVVTDNVGVRRAFRVAKPTRCARNDYSFFEAGWMYMINRSARSIPSNEGDGREMERPERVCWRGGLSAGPPDINEWSKGT